MDYCLRLLALMTATGLPRLSPEQDDLLVALVGSYDTESLDQLAALFEAIRTNATHATPRR